ncbi:MAG TPA: hypothetical protein ENJ52_14730 [Aliiroseovarius sp.]|nr:hypothetical protein [Aliiroseovarius sp.]
MKFKKTLIAGALALSLAVPMPGYAGQARQQQGDSSVIVALALVALGLMILETNGTLSIFSTQNGPSLDTADPAKPAWEF